MKWISWTIVLLGLLLLRINQLQVSTLLYEGDDFEYFSHASSLAYMQFPSYEKEYVPRFDQGKIPLGSVGAGLMAAPFVAGFSLLDRLVDSPIIERRTHDNVMGSWSAFGFIVSTCVYFWFSCFLLYGALRKSFDARTSSLTVIFSVLIQGVSLYVFRRPVLTHIYEIFCQSALVYLLFSNNGEKPTIRLAFLVSLLVSLVTLVRYNNLPMALMWPVVLFMISNDGKLLKQNWRWVGLSCIAIGVMVVVFKYLPMWVSQTNKDPYIKMLENDDFFISRGILFFGKRFIHILIGLDWGLIFSAPFCMIGLVWLFSHSSPWKKRLLLLLSPLIINLFFIIQWRTQGGWYAYRYVIFSLIPLLAWPTAEFIAWLHQKWGKKALVILLLIGLQPFLAMVLFESKVSLGLYLIKQYFGRIGWGNDYYQFEIWMTIFSDPFHLIKLMLRGSPILGLILVAFVMGQIKQRVSSALMVRSLNALILLCCVAVFWVASGVMANHSQLTRLTLFRAFFLILIPIFLLRSVEYFKGKTT